MLLLRLELDQCYPERYLPGTMPGATYVWHTSSAVVTSLRLQLCLILVEGRRTGCQRKGTYVDQFKQSTRILGNHAHGRLTTLRVV